MIPSQDIVLGINENSSVKIWNVTSVCVCVCVYILPWYIFPAGKEKEMCPDVPGGLVQSSALCLLIERKSPPPFASSLPSSSSFGHFAPLQEEKWNLPLQFYHRKVTDSQRQRRVFYYSKNNILKNRCSGKL